MVITFHLNDLQQDISCPDVAPRLHLGKKLLGIVAEGECSWMLGPRMTDAHLHNSLTKASHTVPPH